MPATFTWDIPTLERNNDADEGVIVVHWRLTGDQDGSTAGAYGTQSFTPDPDADDYIAYADLTEATVIGWVTDAIGTEGVQALKDAIQARIDEEVTPTVAHGVPW